MSGADLSGADLSGANLSNSDLSSASLIKTNLQEADLTGSTIYGISALNVNLEGAKQLSLVITDRYELTISVDTLEVAQFISLLLNNQGIRGVIDTITTKVVLVLGRFTGERKAILDALTSELRKLNYSPAVLDFEKPGSRDSTETVFILASLSRFIIVDLTEPSSIPQELQAIVPNRAIPVQPLLFKGKREYAMFVDFIKTYHWVLPVHYYLDQASLLMTLKEKVIEPAEQKAKELEKR